MAEIANTAWYRQGAVSVTNGNEIVTGIGTNWITAGINPGATFRIDNSMYAHEVKSVISDTQIELAKPYNGLTASGVTYSIDRNFQSTSNAKLSADVTAMVRLYENIRDGTMSAIEGRSAYQVAVANGFSGTEAQWLESLKVTSDDYATLAAAIEPFTVHNAYSHNSIARGKNLGSEITAAQIQAIRSEKFTDLYIGDYWALPKPGGGSITARIMEFMPERWTCGRVILWLSSGWKGPMNDTDTCEGALYYSKLYQETLPVILAEVEQVIPPEYIATVSDFYVSDVADSINAQGYVNHWISGQTIEQRIFMPSPINLGFYENDVDPDWFRRNSPYRGLGGLRWAYANYCHWSNHFWGWFGCPSHRATSGRWFAPDNHSRVVDVLATSSNGILPYIFLK